MNLLFHRKEVKTTKILRQVFLAAVAILAIAAASVSSDRLIVKAESNQGGTPVVSLFDYFENGAKIWTLDALGSSPVLYGGFSYNFSGFSAEFVPGLVFNREERLSLKDIVLDADVFFDHGRFSFSVIQRAWRNPKTSSIQLVFES
ncbi:MAG: hypothetical protein UW24_C0022G0013 [Parcubacteria group bacterium GW2011_GWA2_44_12]|nr:MAG: hypothetical protein UW24_C0022G0013 [Parcubacteria group bacterium GW2011_GWA2_44_12]